MPRAPALLLVGGAAGIQVAAFTFAQALGPGPGPLLDAWGRAFAELGALLHPVGGALDALTLPLVLGLAGVGIWRLRQPLAKSIPDAPVSPAWEAAALLTVVACFALTCLSQLDVFPDLDFDELAYAVAARMQLGELEPTWVMAAHPFSKFQVQALPLWLQAAAVGLSGPGVLPIRLVSGLLGTATLVSIHLALRWRIGVRAALVTATLCSVTPLFLASSRSGHYIAFSLWHGTLCLAALLRLVERRDAVSALLLGALLGVGLYAYQLSWFVPLLAAGAYLATLQPARWRGTLGRGLLIAGSAALCLLPAALWLKGGVLAVLAQTLDKAEWVESPGAPGRERDIWRQPVVLARGDRAESTGSLIDLGRGLGLRVHALPGDAGEPIVHLSGRTSELRASLEQIDARGGELLLDGSEPASPARHTLRMLEQLVRRPSLEFAVRVVEVPLLGPVLTPLVILGLVEAWRRRREPVMRILLVWSIGSALAPAAIGGTVARRAALMLPTVCALAALPLAALLRESAPRAPRVRLLAQIGIAIALLAAAGDGLHGYFRHWHRDVRRFSVPPLPAPAVATPSGSLLELAELLRNQPEDRPVLIPRHFRYFKPYWSFVEERPVPNGDARISEWPDAISPERVRAASCARQPPFTWVALPTQRELFEPLRRDHRVVERVSGSYRLWDVEERLPGGCTAGDRDA